MSDGNRKGAASAAPSAVLLYDSEKGRDVRRWFDITLPFLPDSVGFAHERRFGRIAVFEMERDKRIGRTLDEQHRYGAEDARQFEIPRIVGTRRGFILSHVSPLVAFLYTTYAISLFVARAESSLFANSSDRTN